MARTKPLEGFSPVVISSFPFSRALFHAWVKPSHQLKLISTSEQSCFKRFRRHFSWPFQVCKFNSLERSTHCLRGTKPKLAQGYPKNRYARLDLWSPYDDVRRFGGDSPQQTANICDYPYSSFSTSSWDTQNQNVVNFCYRLCVLFWTALPKRL